MTTTTTTTTTTTKKCQNCGKMVVERLREKLEPFGEKNPDTGTFKITVKKSYVCSDCLFADVKIGEGEGE